MKYLDIDVDKILTFIGAFIVSLFAPIVTALLVTGMAIIADTITGIWASVKNAGWKSITSKIGIKGMISKLILYPTAIILASGMQMLVPEIPFIKATVGSLVFWEVWSVYENVTKITGMPLIRLVQAYIKNGINGIKSIMKARNEISK